VAFEVPAAGFQLPGLPEAVGREQRVAGERDHQVAGQADRGHGQGAQPVLRQGGVRAQHARPMGHAPGHPVHVRAEQRDGERGVGQRGWQWPVPGRFRVRAKPRDRHLRHVLFPAAVARGRHVHGVRGVLQERSVRVLGQQRRQQLLAVAGRGLLAAVARGRSAAAPTARRGLHVVHVLRGL